TTPGINNQGMVAFRGVLREGGGGIFTGPDSERDKVIRTGEPLFGSTVTSVGFFGGINDAGQIAFRATLADGRVAMVRADPGRSGGAPGSHLQPPPEIVALLTADPVKRPHTLAGTVFQHGPANAVALGTPGEAEAARLLPPAAALPDFPNRTGVDGMLD